MKPSAIILTRQPLQEAIFLSWKPFSAKKDAIPQIICNSRKRKYSLSSSLIASYFSYYYLLLLYSLSVYGYFLVLLTYSIFDIPLLTPQYYTFPHCVSFFLTPLTPTILHLSILSFLTPTHILFYIYSHCLSHSLSYFIL